MYVVKAFVTFFQVLLQLLRVYSNYIRAHESFVIKWQYSCSNTKEENFYTNTQHFITL